MSATTSYADWIAVDWGTTNLRAWAMRRDGTTLDVVKSDQGMSSLTSDEFEPCLLNLIEPWLGSGSTPVVACGMVGSRQGWTEAPYRAVPTTPAGLVHNVICKDPRITAHVLPGLKQLQHPDVMRGEETQIAGYLATNPDFDGVLCLPGTHTKWVRISAGEVVSFQTFMTGEMFDLLSTQSVLRHSVGTLGDWDQGVFEASISDAISHPAMMATKLFQLRASDLLEGVTPAANRARMSGLLIGMELAGAKPYWLGQEVALVGASALNDLYAAALTAQGLEVTKHSGDEMTLKGLTAAYQESIA
jgi:2-dehydro-3-deoxygalactonokinase